MITPQQPSDPVLLLAAEIVITTHTQKKVADH